MVNHSKNNLELISFYTTDCCTIKIKEIKALNLLTSGLKINKKKNQQQIKKLNFGRTKSKMTQSLS